MSAASFNRLDGHCALVSGGTGGIACARGFVEAGVDRIMRVGRNAERGRRATAELHSDFPGRRVETTSVNGGVSAA